MNENSVLTSPPLVSSVSICLSLHKCVFVLTSPKGRKRMLKRYGARLFLGHLSGNYQTACGANA